ncbi:MAG: hypothetical protein OXM61_08455 [Candidatus Poribacteria bacterium]|nr:hypothetical protein [Candidatus Poribacteria bacterium]
MQKHYTIIALLLVACLGLTVALSQDGGIAEEIEAVVMENLRATQAEDLNAMLNTIHSESPLYSQTEEMATVLFENYDVNYGLLVFRYIEQDEEYAIVRLKYSAQKLAGPDFNDNNLDTIHVFREENGSWKIWSMAILEIEYI